MQKPGGSLSNTQLPNNVGASPRKYAPLRRLHEENAESPMDVTLLGMVTLVRPLQSLHTPCSMDVTPAGTV